MAHEISNVNGVNEAAYALKPAWHGLGHVLDHAPNSEEMVKAAHLDWTVSKRPLRTDEGEGSIAIPGQFATVRDDINRPLGVVGEDYTVVQNAEAFAFLDGLLQDGVMKYEAAGALKGGRLVWVLARMPGFDLIGDGDQVDRYIMFSTSHDGWSSLYAIPTSVRVVCWNTWRAATINMSGIRHTSGVKTNLKRMEMYLSQFDAAFTLFRDNARLLLNRKLKSSKQVSAYLDRLFPLKDDATESAKTRREDKVVSIAGNLKHATNMLPGMKDTWWAMYNAVSLYTDHQTKFRGEREEPEERRLVSVTNGPVADLKNRAFELALEMSAK